MHLNRRKSKWTDEIVVRYETHDYEVGSRSRTLLCNPQSQPDLRSRVAVLIDEMRLAEEMYARSHMDVEASYSAGARMILDCMAVSLTVLAHLHPPEPPPFAPAADLGSPTFWSRAQRWWRAKRRAA